MEKDEAISLYVYLRLENPIVKSAFKDNEDYTYEEYCDKILADVEFKKAEFIKFMEGNMSTFIEELAELIKINKVPVHVSSDAEAMG